MCTPLWALILLFRHIFSQKVTVSDTGTLPYLWNFVQHLKWTENFINYFIIIYSLVAMKSLFKLDDERFSRPVFRLGLILKMTVPHNIISVPWTDFVSVGTTFFHENASESFLSSFYENIVPPHLVARQGIEITVKPVIWDHPFCHWKVVLHDRWSLSRGTHPVVLSVRNQKCSVLYLLMVYII